MANKYALSIDRMTRWAYRAGVILGCRAVAARRLAQAPMPDWLQLTLILGGEIAFFVAAAVYGFDPAYVMQMIFTLATLLLCLMGVLMLAIVVLAGLLRCLLG